MRERERVAIAKQVMPYCSFSDIANPIKKYLQFNGLVPVDDIAREGKSLDVSNVDISSLRPYVEPFTLERQVAVGDSTKQRRISTGYFIKHNTVQNNVKIQ